MTRRTERVTPDEDDAVPASLLDGAVPVARLDAAPMPPTPGRPAPAAYPVSRTRRLRTQLRPLRVATERRLDGLEHLLDPVLRPVVAAVQECRGGPDTDRLLRQYRAGAYLTVGRWGRYCWVEPRRRAVIPLRAYRVPKNAARAIRSGRYDLTFDTAFAEVLEACATVRDRALSGRPWLTPAVQRAYHELYRLGHAHSVEVWRAGRLVGGELGVSLGGLYSGESMFYRESGAGKVALAHLLRYLDERGFTMLDTQVLTPVMEQFGAVTIPRAEYRRRLREAVATEVTFHP